MTPVVFGLPSLDPEMLITSRKLRERARMSMTTWPAHATGADRYGCEIIAETVDFLSPAKQTESEDGKFIDDDDIPF